MVPNGRTNSRAKKKKKKNRLKHLNWPPQTDIKADLSSVYLGHHQSESRICGVSALRYDEDMKKVVEVEVEYRIGKLLRILREILRKNN